MSALLRNTAALVDDHPQVAYPQTNILAPFQRLHIIALAFWVFRVGLDLALYASTLAVAFAAIPSTRFSGK